MAMILVVDDSAVDRELIKGLLTSQPDFEAEAAESSRSALAKLHSGRFDLVVTDLQMPDMDGLELVKTLRQEFPDLPTILVTAHGSEQIAAAALDEGAAGYVPKSELAGKLVETVRNTLVLLQAERSYADLVDHTTLSEFHFELNHDPRLIPPLVDLAQQMISGVGHRNPVDRVRIGVAIEQALTNALYHGNLELAAGLKIPGHSSTGSSEFQTFIAQRIIDPLYANRKIHVEMRITREQAKFTIRDEGNGFRVPAAHGIEEGRGRGLVLIRSFMDEVSYNERGNELTMTRRWDPAAFTESAIRRSQQFDDTMFGTNVSEPAFGKFVSERSGRTIPLSEKRLVIGRRKTCHIVLPYREVSAHHCQMYVVDGFWFVKDLESGNGIRINGKPVKRGRLDPGDTLTVAKYNYRIDYTPVEFGAGAN
jgi:CheY-like chemotaxis protein